MRKVAHFWLRCLDCRYEFLSTYRHSLCPRCQSATEVFGLEERRNHDDDPEEIPSTV